MAEDVQPTSQELDELNATLAAEADPPKPAPVVTTNGANIEQPVGDIQGICAHCGASLLCLRCQGDSLGSDVLFAAYQLGHEEAVESIQWVLNNARPIFARPPKLHPDEVRQRVAGPPREEVSA